MKGKSWINILVHCSALLKEEYKWEAHSWATALQPRPISHVPSDGAQETCPQTGGWHTAGGSSCILPSFQASSPSDARLKHTVRVDKAFTILYPVERTRDAF